MVASRLAGPSPLVSLGSYCGHRSARKYSSWSRAVASASRGGVTPVIAAEKAGCIVAESVWYHGVIRSEEHTSELQSLAYLVCRLLLEKKKEITQAQSCLPKMPAVIRTLC